VQGEKNCGMGFGKGGTVFSGEEHAKGKDPRRVTAFFQGVGGETMKRCLSSQRMKVAAKQSQKNEDSRFRGGVGRTVKVRLKREGFDYLCWKGNSWDRWESVKKKVKVGTA